MYHIEAGADVTRCRRGRSSVHGHELVVVEDDRMQLDPRVITRVHIPGGVLSMLDCYWSLCLSTRFCLFSCEF